MIGNGDKIHLAKLGLGIYLNSGSLKLSGHSIAFSMASSASLLAFE